VKNFAASGKPKQEFVLDYKSVRVIEKIVDDEGSVGLLEKKVRAKLMANLAVVQGKLTIDEAKEKYKELIPREDWPYGELREQVDKAKNSRREYCIDCWDAFLVETKV
jgi:hypothetical protein